MKTKFLLIAGAGCTLSDALSKSSKNRPPLDKGFFAKLDPSYELDIVRDYLLTTYDFDPFDLQHDSLESVMAIIYADIHNPELQHSAVNAFRSLILLFNQRMAETTNSLMPTNRSNLYRILCGALDRGFKPEEICIITYNQDIQVEKVLSKINLTSRATRQGGVFNFPFCYCIPNPGSLVTAPKSPDTKKFTESKSDTQTVRLLKLHGSLNWYSIHNTRDVRKNAILNPSRRYHITPRATLTPGLTFTGKRTLYTFPLIVPPVTHKAGILHKDILPLWSQATVALAHAHEIVVFGYSCPANDFESANLIRRTVHSNANLKQLSVIDPNPDIFRRYVDLTGLKRIFWFKSAPSFVEWYRP